MPTLAERVVAIETALSFWKMVIGGFSGAALLAGLGALSWCYHLGTKVAVIESGGDTKLVTELKTPKSHEQLRANLSMVTPQVETARANGIKPNTKKAKALSDALSLVIKRDPDIPQVWQAASELISYRYSFSEGVELPPEIARMFGSPVPNSGNCFEQQRKLLIPPPAAGPPLLNILTWNDCTLRLDDIEGYENSLAVQLSKQHNASPVPIRLALVRVKIVYHGGPIIPIVGMQTFGCEFEFEVPTVPPVRARQLLEAILAEDSTNPNIAIPNA
jgi:hypothetical protein